MLVRIALLLLSCAIMLFIVMTGLFNFGFRLLAELMRWIAAESLLVGALLLGVAGLAQLLSVLMRHCRSYFSASANQQRQLWYNLTKKTHSETQFRLKIQQIHYFAELKRRRLLAANNAKQSAQLCKCIQRDLKRLRPTLPAEQYRQLQRQSKACLRAADMQALIQLQQQLNTYQ